MGKIKKFLMLMAAGIIIEVGSFAYLNNVFLKKKAVITFKNLETKTGIYDEKIIKLPLNYSKLKISDRGEYGYYIDKDEFKVINLTNKNETTFLAKKGYKIINYGWMPYENKIFFLEGNDLIYNIVVYSVESNTIIKEANIIKLNSQNKNKISYNEAKTSTGFGGFAIKGTENGYDHIIYFGINEMVNYDTIKYLNAIKIESFFPGNNEDDFVMQDKNSKAIYEICQPPNFISPVNFKIISADKKNQKINTKNIENPELLYVDERGNMYIGSNKNGKIDKIYYKNLNDKNKTFKYYSVKNPLDKSNIVFTQNGDIYAVYKNKIENVKNENSINYNGKFVEINSGKLFYEDGGYLMERKL